MPYRKKNSDNWYITWSENGKQRTRSSRTSDFREAKRLENKLRAKELKAVSLYSIDSVLSEYIKAKPTPRAGYAVKQLIEAWSGIAIEDITPTMIAGYKSSRGVEDGTLKRELGVLRTAIKYCNHELGWQLPEILQGRIPKEPKGRVRWITRNQSKELIKAAAPHLKLFIIIGLYAGLRKSEVLKLTWDRVDLEHGVIHFAPNQHKSKTYATVPINKYLRRILRLARGDKRHVLTYRGKRVSDIKKALQGACARSGIEDFTPHDLRHTCASWMVQKGVPIASVKEVLRHGDISTTMRYAHLAPDNARSAVSALLP